MLCIDHPLRTIWHSFFRSFSGKYLHSLSVSMYSSSILDPKYKTNVAQTSQSPSIINSANHFVHIIDNRRKVANPSSIFQWLLLLNTRSQKTFPLPSSRPSPPTPNSSSLQMPSTAQTPPPYVITLPSTLHTPPESSLHQLPYYVTTFSRHSHVIEIRTKILFLHHPLNHHTQPPHSTTSTTPHVTDSSQTRLRSFVRRLFRS